MTQQYLWKDFKKTIWKRRLLARLITTVYSRKVAIVFIVLCLLIVAMTFPQMKISVDDVIDDVISNPSKRYVKGKFKQQHQTGANNSDLFPDDKIERLLSQLEEDDKFNFTVADLKTTNLRDFVIQYGREMRVNAPQLSAFKTRPPSSESTNHYKFNYGIRKHSLYDPLDPAVDGLLHDMATGDFLSNTLMAKGTELKLLVEFTNKHVAVFKPRRWNLEYETLPNHFYFDDFERHNAEIAAFHLDRILGFYRVPPVTGRLVNMTKEIFMITDKVVKNTFYVSPIGNVCFYGVCSLYCDDRHSFCGDVDMLEGSLMALLPIDVAATTHWVSPYRRSYNAAKKAKWEKDEDYCNHNVKNTPPYNNTKMLLDLIDSAVFDFLTGNMDRHHTVLFQEFGNESFVLHMDNGRAFGKSKVDEFSIIAPLRQCCVIRESTFLKLTKLYLGPERLSDVLDESLKRDPLYPILTQGHLLALDRRVLRILRIVADCVTQITVSHQVIINDGF